ncbi:MAG: XdhC family protein [Deltaproteobacteria bacterium]|nr:XdhC family protein [Deltaproteobacteria bacterium]
MEVKEVYQALGKLIAEGERVAVATVVKVKGSTPREVGAKMAIRANGSFVGTVGGGCGEAEVWQAAMEALKDGKPRMVNVDLTQDIETGTDKVCGGIMEIFVDVWPRETSKAEG